MVMISELECDPVIRNAIVRWLKTDDASRLRSMCVCDVLDLPNMGLKRIHRLQTALQAHGLSLAPCRFVPFPVRPGRKTPDYQHQVNVSGSWCEFHTDHDGATAYVPVGDQYVDLPSRSVSLTMLTELFGT